MAAGIRVVPADPAAAATERVTFGQAVLRAAGYLVSALPAGLGFLPALLRPSAARCTTASPTRASSKRDSPRRLPRHGRLLRLFPDRAGHRRIRRRPRRLPAGLVDAVADRRSRPDRADLFAAGIWAGDHARSATSAASIPGPSSSTKSLGMLITLAFIPVGWSGALAGFVMFRIFDVIKPYPAPARDAARRLRHHGRRRDGRRSTPTCRCGC